MNSTAWRVMVSRLWRDCRLCNPFCLCGRADSSLPEKEELIRSNLCWPQTIRGFPKVFRKLCSMENMVFDGLRRTVADLQVFDHPLA